MGDFETTVYKGQANTEVWASAVVEMFSENVTILHSIDETFQYLTSLKSNIIIYYHNLKFDGAFWLSYFLTERNFQQAYEKHGDSGVCSCEWLPEKEMRNNTVKYSISDRGQWYTVTVKYRDCFIEIRDSLKLLPFSVKKIGKSFGTKHHKLDMEYEGFRYAGCDITDKEKEYIKNDVLVVNEALEIMYKEGHTKLTIGSCCLEEFKKIIGKEDYDQYFPSLAEIDIDAKKYDSNTVDEYIRNAYRGGWCYVVKGKEGKIFNNGVTADVNSLYPSMMSSESGNRYPVGKPCFWSGNIIPGEAIGINKYYFLRIRTRFYLKEGFLPFIQIKSSFNYKGTECLETSDVKDAEGRYSRYYTDMYGVERDTAVEMTVSMVDFELMKKHYELVDFEILDGCWFYSEIGLFDAYIGKYKEIKMKSKGAIRELAKLFLNNLYGKLASSTESSFKVAYVKPDGSLGYEVVPAYDKKAGHIAAGAAITSYARAFTITAAQKNYHGADQPGFIYADTDSIHCDLKPVEIQGIKVDNNAFCHWKLESYWSDAIFARQKTYIEVVTHEDGKEVEPYYNIKCAGMPQRCKDLLVASMEGFTDDEHSFSKEEELEFIRVKRTLHDFKRGLKVPSKLRPKTIRGGVLLVECEYSIR